MKLDMNQSLDRLLAIAIKAELDAQKTYSELSKVATTFILKDKLLYLAGEEEKHETILRGVFEKHFPGKEPRLPGESAAPTPRIDFNPDNPLSELLFQAMEAELEAEKFYNGLAQKFPEPKVEKLLKYMARVEHGHYQLLKGEREALLDFEVFDEYNEMMHIGT